LKDYDYSQAGGYFVTICTQNRQCLFGDIADGKMVLNDAGWMVSEAWEWLEKQYNYVELDKWGIMPNHMHGIIIINDGRGLFANHPLLAKVP
jgi:REP element-mobilizing transposase RayT